MVCPCKVFLHITKSGREFVEKLFVANIDYYHMNISLKNFLTARLRLRGLRNGLFVVVVVVGTLF